MNTQELPKLARLFRQEAKSVLATWRAEACKLPSAKDLSVPVLNDHIPLLLEELAVAFETRSDVSITEALIAGTPEAHGEQRVADGFDIVEVVAEYNILRGCLHDVADKAGINMAGRPFHILNRVFDGAIGLAVESYATQRAAEVLKRRQDHLAFMTHDLRTPLNAISLATSVLESTLPQGSEGARMVDILHRNVGQLLTMVNKVLEEEAHVDTVVGVKPELRHFDLWPLVETLIMELKPAADPGSTVLRNTVPTDMVVHADASLVRRIFQNLIGNAIAYTPLGEITIGAQAVDQDDRVECWVSDTGKGIPAKQLSHVFQKGQGDKDREGSSGLGLAIVKLFVEAHGGAVHVESVEGKGCTFRFTLPTQEKQVSKG
jgi:signal transduction histidine kinase